MEFYHPGYNENRRSENADWMHPQKAIGITPSEKYLSLLCERTFLSLWSYPNVFRKGAKQTREVCDLLVVFEDTLILFSDKDIGFPKTDIVPAWNRWFRNAILKSAKQIWGAERWLNSPDAVVFLDAKCQTPLPVQLPESTHKKIFRVVVAHGVDEVCKSIIGGSGSLMVNPSIVGTGHYISADSNASLFSIGQLDSGKGFVHVLTDVSLDILLSTLDTITDFIRYLEKKEELIKSDKLIFAPGEEDMLGYYLKHVNELKEHDFVLPNNKDKLILGDDFWGNFVKSGQRARQVEADRISYVWDGLIEKFSFHGLNGTGHFSTSETLEHTELILRFMAKEPRLRRRFLSERLTSAVSLTGKEQRFTRVVIPDRPGYPYYVFLSLDHPSYATYESYRVVRRNMLSVACTLVKIKFPEAEAIVGIATESRLTETRSEDAIYLNARIISESDRLEALEIQAKIGLLTELIEYRASISEYPE